MPIFITNPESQPEEEQKHQFSIGELVRVVNDDQVYPYFTEWVQRHCHKTMLHVWNPGWVTPREVVGKIGVVIQIAPRADDSKENILAVIVASASGFNLVLVSEQGINAIE